MRYALRDRSSEIPERYKEHFIAGAAEAVVSPEWKLDMSEELAALEGTGT
jgi:hypothetical protein